MKKINNNSIFFEKNNIFYQKALKLAKENQRIDDLQCDGHCVIQNPKGYCFTSDSVLLANFATPKSNSNILELCAGCGVISILIDAKNQIKSFTAVELQKTLYDLCKKNFEININAETMVYNCNLKDFPPIHTGKPFDCVVCNPPYEKLQTSFTKFDEEKSIARAEKMATMHDIAQTVSKCLKFGGYFYFLFKAERLAECFEILKQYNLEPKVIQFIHEKISMPAKLFMCKAILGGKNGINILPPIIRNNEDGSESEQIKNIYQRN